MTPFQQKDARWGSVVYTSVGDKSQTIGTSGCGLLALTNAIYALTVGNVFLDPIELNKLSVANGFRTPNDGTSWSFASWYVKNMFASEFSITSTSETNTAIAALKKGNAAIYTSCHGNAKRIFTTAGHYLAINDYTQDGFFCVLDSDFYNGKYDVGERMTERRNGQLGVDTRTREIWCKPELFKPEMTGIGYVIITYNPKNKVEDKEDAIMPDMIHWFTKVSELPDWAAPAIRADVAQGVIKLADDGDSFSAPKSDIEIQGRVEAYRHLKALGIISQTDLTKRA